MCADVCDKKRITILHCHHENMQRSDQGLGRVHQFVELGVGPSRGQKVAFKWTEKLSEFWLETTVYKWCSEVAEQSKTTNQVAVCYMT